MNVLRTSAALALATATMLGATVQSAIAALPRPVIANAKKVAVSGGIRHTIAVVNRAAYPPGLFAPAPFLFPPCGHFNAGTRTQVDIFSGRRRLAHFCGIRTPSALAALSFVTPFGQRAPRTVFIVMRDRIGHSVARSAVLAVTP
jgi:hypothetical protein